MTHCWPGAGTEWLTVNLSLRCTAEGNRIIPPVVRGVVWWHGSRVRGGGGVCVCVCVGCGAVLVCHAQPAWHTSVLHAVRRGSDGPGSRKRGSGNNLRRLLSALKSTRGLSEFPLSNQYCALGPEVTWCLHAESRQRDVAAAHWRFGRMGQSRCQFCGIRRARSNRHSNLVLQCMSTRQATMPGFGPWVGSAQGTRPQCGTG